MESKNQNGQALIEFIFVGAFFISLILAIEAMIQQKNNPTNQHKLSTEVKNEFRYKNKN